MNVILYGIGKRFNQLFDDREFLEVGLLRNEVKIVGLADSNPDVWGRKLVYNGQLFVVKNIDEFPADLFDKILVVSKNYFEQICNTLKQKGFKQKHILLIDEFFEAKIDLIDFISNEQLIIQWDQLNETGRTISSFLKSENYQKIVVCGEGLLAERLIGDLHQSNIKVEYICGKGSWDIEPIFENKNAFSETDIILVVAMGKDYTKMECRLCEKYNVEVISIQELIYKTLKNINRE